MLFLNSPVSSTLAKTTMSDTRIKITINVYTDEDNREVVCAQTFYKSDPLVSDLLDVCYDALRAAGYYPDGK